MVRDGSAAGRLPMSLRRLAQQQVDGLNEGAQAALAPAYLLRQIF